MRRHKFILIAVLVHLALLIPLALLAVDWTQDQLTANPIREIQLRTGRYALFLLVLTLACAPVYNISGFKPVLSLRRILGLYAFGYALLHLLNFIGLDYGFNFALLWADISEKRYIIVGFIAFLILLAVTSLEDGETAWVEWRRLYAIYLAGLGGVALLWQLKVGFNNL
jgi:sulfoxide reductase heme-binding subunit YedZ